MQKCVGIPARVKVKDWTVNQKKGMLYYKGDQTSESFSEREKQKSGYFIHLRDKIYKNVEYFF